MKTFSKVDLIELNEAYQKVLQWFFSFPTIPISLSELSKELSISKKTANKLVLQLLEESFLIKEEVGRTWRISCNQKHAYNYTRKISHNLSLLYSILYEAGVIEDIYRICGNPKAIMLFGSYRKGDDNEKSDIDLAVEVVSNEELKIIHLGNLPQLGYRKNVPINLHVFSRNKIDLNLFANIANGIILEGFLEVRP